MSRSATSWLVDILDSAHVQAARRLDRHEQLGVLVDLAGHDGLLLVAAGHAAGHGDGPWPQRTSYWSMSRWAYLRMLSRRRKPALSVKLRLEVALEHQIVLQRVVQHQTVLMTVLGDVGHAHAGCACEWGRG